MNTNDNDAIQLTTVDIELPLDLAEGSDWEGVDVSAAYARTAFAALGEDVTPVLPAGLAEVAAHPARLRMRWSGPVLSGESALSAARAIRTGCVGLGELAACGQ